MLNLTSNTAAYGLPLPRRAGEVPVSQLQQQFFSPAIDQDQNGRLTRQELQQGIGQLQRQLASSTFLPGGDQALTTRLDLLQAMDQDFETIRSNRGLQPGQITTMDVRPEDSTIELNELQAISQRTGNPNSLSRADIEATRIENQPRPIDNPLPPVALPVDQIQGRIMASTDLNQDGNLTQAEIRQRLQTLIPPGALIRLSPQEQLDYDLLQGIQQNFNRIANSRGLGDDQPRTLEFRPEDGTIQANELAAVARIDGNPDTLSRVDLQRMSQGARIPSATVRPIPPVVSPPLPPGTVNPPPSNGLPDAGADRFQQFFQQFQLLFQRFFGGLFSF